MSPALQMDSLPAELQEKPKITGGVSLSILQGNFMTQELNWGLLHCRQILNQLNYQGAHCFWYTGINFIYLWILLHIIYYKILAAFPVLHISVYVHHCNFTHSSLYCLIYFTYFSPCLPTLPSDNQ